ncbi:hypothetical protein [Fimbriiglobus ruber]|uniref:DUF2267 domain-containing protein n=1 Tax=Fimbriiglobus ruber TaxID=1908690 RepID=A0A225D0Q9_9BACT|nr:hypothetical protein [Fimbriiglobus ruber]OWK35092.1 hypothetical protein FRUB_09934 [Fimbriiglobus ruber]
MDELVKQVADKTGINPDQAKAAVAVVVAHIKEKLPPALAEQVESLLSGNPGAAQELFGSVAGKLGGLFGGK